MNDPDSYEHIERTVPVARGEYSVVGRITANGGIDTPPLAISLTN